MTASAGQWNVPVTLAEPPGELPAFWTSVTFWDDVGVVTVVLTITALFVWALLTERLVLGRQYRKVEERCNTLEETNMTLMRELMGQNASNQITNGLLAAIRQEFSSTPPSDEVS